MSLYTSVYWTKRVAVVFSILLLLCGGYNLFTFIASKFSDDNLTISEPKPELGFGLLDNLTITPPLDIPPTFAPNGFVNSTVKGTFDVDNGYPGQSTKSPIANVYKIATLPIDLNTTEVPRKIAKAMKFTSEPQQVSPAIQTWKESGRNLEINGQYLLIKYANDNLKKNLPATTNSSTKFNFQESNGVKSYFESVMREFGITSDFSTYKFRAEYVDYNKAKNEFQLTGIAGQGQYIRLNADRVYPNLSKINKESSTVAAYPNYIHSNNYIIVPATVPANAKVADYLAEFSLYNWPINQTISEKNKEVQTYHIKTPKKAYDELVASNKYLISATEWGTRKPIITSELAGITRVDILRIRLEMYEDTLNTTYIQPVYVFTAQAVKDDKSYELIYFVPAVTDIIK